MCLLETHNIPGGTWVQFGVQPSVCASRKNSTMALAVLHLKNDAFAQMSIGMQRRHGLTKTTSEDWDEEPITPAEMNDYIAASRGYRTV